MASSRSYHPPRLWGRSDPLFVVNIDLALVLAVALACAPFAFVAWVFRRAGEVNKRSMDEARRGRKPQ